MLLLLLYCKRVRLSKQLQTCLFVPRLPAHMMASDLEWKVIYVGSAEDTRYDQVLEEVDVGPIPIGVNKFVLTAGGKRNTLESARCWGMWAGGEERVGVGKAHHVRNTRAPLILSLRLP